jgi:hypothetical protein
MREKKLWQLANATIYSWFQSMLMKMFPQYIRHNMIVGKRSNLTSLEIRLHVQELCCCSHYKFTLIFLEIIFLPEFFLSLSVSFDH